jgi:hypothetical protein
MRHTRFTSNTWAQPTQNLTVLGRDSSWIPSPQRLNGLHSAIRDDIHEADQRAKPFWSAQWVELDCTPRTPPTQETRCAPIVRAAAETSRAARPTKAHDVAEQLRSTLDDIADILEDDCSKSVGIFACQDTVCTVLFGRLGPRRGDNV